MISPSQNSPSDDSARRGSPQDWEEFLSRELLNYEAQLHSDHPVPSESPLQSPSPNPPSAVLAELQELQDCLLLVDLLRDLPRDQNLQTVEPPQDPADGTAHSGLAPTYDPSLSTASLKSDGREHAPTPDFSDLRLGRFTLGEKLGEGTYGIVYRAHDPRLRRWVALKVPRAETAFRTDLAERFLREGESAARLMHTNIVTVHEAVAEGPVSLIVSEYIPGPNLANWLKGRAAPVPPRQAARLIAALADGVAHAHSRNVLHRDIKPGNILLAPRPEYASALAEPGTDLDLDAYEPKLTDFGLAKLLETQDSTLSGAIIGTPAYMPPEQIAGHLKDIGPPVDIYALGMVLYELVVGKNPYLHESIGETIHAVTQTDLPNPASLCRNLPRDLETIILKCLRRERQERYPSATDLAADLRRYLNNQPIRARNASIPERTLKWIRRYPSLTATTFAAFSCLLALLLVSWWQNGRVESLLVESQRNLDEVNQQTARLKRQAYVNDMRRVGEAWNTNHIQTALMILNSHIPKEGEPDLRDFSWWAIWNTYHDHSRVIGTHAGGATAVVCKTQAPYLAFSGGQDASIKIWSIPEGNQVGELRGHSLGPIQSLDLNPEESLLLSTADDGTVRIWDLESRSEKMVFREHQGWVATARFSPDGRIVASAGKDMLIHIWDVESGETLRTLKGHTAVIRSVGFHPDHEHSSLLVSSSQDGTVRIWDYIRGVLWHGNEKLPEGQLPLKNPSWGESVEFSHGGKQVAVASVGVWPLAGEKLGSRNHTFNSKPRTRCLKSLIDGRILFALDDSSIQVGSSWDEPDQLSAVLRGHLSGEVMDIALFPNDKGFISVCSNGEIRVWSPETLDSDLSLIPEHASYPFVVRWNKNHIEYFLHPTPPKFLYGAIRMPDRTPIAEMLYPPKTFDYAAIQPEEQTIWRIKPDKIESLEVPGFQPRWSRDLPFAEPVRHYDLSRTFDFSHSGKLAAITHAREGLILDGLSGNILARLRFRRNPSQLRFLRYSPTLVITGGDGFMRIWDLNELRDAPHVEKRLHDSSIHAFAFSPDEKLVATVAENREVIVWSFPDFQEVSRISLSIIEDADRLFFVDSGKTLVMESKTLDRLSFWNLEFQQLQMNLDIDMPRKMDVNPDGTQFAIEAEHGIRILDGKVRP